jgi:predicted lipid-binding transport protein (Tim44 family)
MQQPQSSFWRGLGGGILGGFLGGMLFRSLGFGGGQGMGTGGGSGFGWFEILLIGAILFGIYYFIKKRRQAALAGGSYQSSAESLQPSYTQPSYGTGDGSYPPQEEPEGELNRGIGFIRQMDPSFEEKNFIEAGSDIFFRIQGAWANRDMTGVRNLLTGEMFNNTQGDADKLKAEKKINRLDNIAVRSVEITEAWQESGQDFITVRFLANLLDYTVDETTGTVVEGSKTEPVKFEEYWTFARPVGKGPWQLSAIQQAQ